jgi:hypothetical protein
MEPPSNQLYSNEADHFRHEGASEQWHRRHVSQIASPWRFFAAALVSQLYNTVQPRKVPTGVAVSAVGTSLELKSHAKRYLI